MTSGEPPGLPRITSVGEERAPVIIIDNFLKDPARLVDMAASCTYRSVTNNLYPGVRASAPRGYAQTVVTATAALVREAFGLRDIISVECDFSLVTTRPECLKLLQAMPHFDTTNVQQIAVLHYLCPPERGGTSFYRHRSTGFESITAERHDRYMAILGSELKASGPPDQAYINGDTALFERIGTVEAAFNRLVIYRSAVLHSGDIGRQFSFTQDVHTGRLTVNTFIHFAPG